ncbi:MAG TPA: hypothetical protein GX518_05020 [Firmicutes bacterium]|nr:hypothetical protein [Bacillota bacterium]
MVRNKKAVYFFCAKQEIDPVAGRVFAAVEKIYSLVEAGLDIDAQPVLKHIDDQGNEFYFVRTSKVIHHEYRNYLPLLNSYFAAFDFAGLVTWHEGENAPDRIFPVHTMGDVDSGYFGRANPVFMHNLFLSLEQNRVAAGLEDFRVTTEGTHWSGMVFAGNPELIPQFPVPLVDIEIGSTPASWSNATAAEVLARALTGVFADSGKTLKNLLCVGGTHFDPAFAGAVLETWDGHAFGISHILPNHWLVSGQYEKEAGQEKLENCLQSIEGGVAGIVFHDKLKGAYKDQLRQLGKKYNIPVFKHQLLRRPLDIPWNA